VIENNVEIDAVEARELIQSCFAELSHRVDQNGPFVPTSDYPDLEILEQEALAKERVNDLQRQIISWNFGSDISKLASENLSKRGIQIEGLSQQDRLKLLYGFAIALEEHQHYFLHRLQNPLGTFQPQNSVFDNLEPPAQSQKFFSTPVVIPTGPTVAQAVIDYLDAKEKSWVTKTHRARVWQLGYLVEFLGNGKRITDVVPADIREFRKKLTELRAKHGQGKSLGFFEKLTDNENARIKNKTARLIYEPTQAFFRWAKFDEGLIANNPAEDVKWIIEKTPKGIKSRRPYTKDELLTLFSCPLFTGCKSKDRRFLEGEHIFKDAKYWIPVLGYYTGARLGELVQLHVNDVNLDCEIPYLDLNEKQGLDDKKHIKTNAGIRQIPLHPDVLHLGFADFVAQRKKWNCSSRRLFSEIKFGSDGQASTEFSKFFARFLDKIGLTDSSLTFHSFRHGAEDAFRNALQPQYVIDAIMGHCDGKVSSLYGDGSSLDVNSKAVNALALPLFLPNLWCNDCKGGDQCPCN